MGIDFSRLFGRRPVPRAEPGPATPILRPGLQGDIASRPSPNKSPRRSREIDLVVLHATVGNFEPSVHWLRDPASKVSAHYVVGRDGQTVQLVPEAQTAWHAGRSIWRGIADVNDRSIGIEIENTNDGHDVYPEEQLEAVIWLCVRICRLYAVQPVDVVGHLDVAPGRKTDPAGFPWRRFRGWLGRHLAKDVVLEAPWSSAAGG